MMMTRNSRVPTRIRVRAQIEWAGHVDSRNGGVRETTLDGLDLTKVMDCLKRSRKASRRVEKIEPLRSYRARGWHAQLRQLTRHGRGSAAADRAGLDVTAATLLHWLAEQETPSTENQAKISRAYDALRTWDLDAARADANQARHEMSQRLTEALRDRYSVNVRLRNIQSLTFLD